jgi:drug/metabolite transporter (DMT)-like permease
VIYGLISAVLYASVTLSNKYAKGLSGLEITLIQLVGAFVVILPYVLFTHSNTWVAPTFRELIYLLILGFVHTGIALYLYFSAIQELPGQSVALCSYIDPVSALFFAAIFLGDRLTVLQLLGAALILGGALTGELLGKDDPNGVSVQLKQKV